MTASLPGDGTNPYGDQLRTWLQVAHNSDGTQKSGSQLPWLNPADYGAAGNGSTDDSSALQTMIADLPATGGWVYAPKQYKVLSELDFGGHKGVRWSGMTGVAYNEGSPWNGSGIIAGTPGMTVFNFDGSSGGPGNAGLLAEHTAFIDNAGSSSRLVNIKQFDFFQFDRCPFIGHSDKTTIGVEIDGTVTDSSWHHFINCTWYRPGVGLKIDQSFGITLLGGQFTGGAKGLSLGAGSGGLRCTNTKIDAGSGAGYKWLDSLGYEFILTGCSYEHSSGSNTATFVNVDGNGSSPSGYRNQIIGCTYSGLGSTSGDLGINITSLAHATTVIGGSHSNFLAGSDLVDNGVNTLVIQNPQGGSSSSYIKYNNAPLGGNASWGSEILTYGTTIAVNASAVTLARIVVTDGTAFTISNPSNATDGQVLTFNILNSSGGTIGNVTWDTAFYDSWSNSSDKPANGLRTMVTFVYDGASSKWLETAKRSSF